MFQQLPIVVKRTSLSLRKRGFYRTAKIALWEIISIFWENRTYFKFHASSANVCRMHRPLAKVTFCELLPEEMSELCKFSLQFSSKDMQQRLLLGHKCIIGRIGSKLVAHAWIGLGPRVYLPLIGTHIDLLPNTGYFYNLYVDEKARGQRIFPAMVSFLRNFIIDIGLENGILFVDARMGVQIKSYAQIVGADQVYLVHYKKRFFSKKYVEKEISFIEADEISRNMSGTVDL